MIKMLTSNLLKIKRIAVIGYGSQGHAHANNLKDSGADVIVGLPQDSKSWKKAEDAGLEVIFTSDAAEKADVIMMVCARRTRRRRSIRTRSNRL